MKYFSVIIAFVFVIIALGLWFTRGDSHDSKISTGKTKVALFMNGPKNDHSWSEAHYIGMQKTAEKLGLDVAYYDNVPLDSTSIPIMEKAISDGARIIVCNSIGFGPYELLVAQLHPEVKFFHATGIKQSRNLSTYFARIYQIRYLSGIVAGMETKNGHIGYVAAFDIPEVVRGINAFTLGVRKVNPSATVHVNWTRSWTDANIAASATEDLIHQYNIDILTVHTDVLSPYKIAEKHNIGIIGYNFDNSSLYPRNFMTAALWDWEQFYTPRILEVIQGKYTSKNYWLGIESGIITLAPFTSRVHPETKIRVTKEWQNLLSGYHDVFYGKIVDNTGTTRIDSGESMTDHDMLENFNWFVQGVEVYEKNQL